VTITYALTRAEIVRSYFQSLASSRKFLLRILVYCAALGLLHLIFSGSLSRPFQAHDLFVTLAWMLGVFAFIPTWLFLRGKTSERTLSVSSDGISTQIGSMKGQVPWGKVSLVADTSNHVLIVGTIGNAFFIPARAFQGPEHQAKFIEQIDSLRSSQK